MWPRALWRLSLLFLALLLGGNAHAFGSFGHQLIADLAQARLTPEAAGRVDGLLALEGITHLRDISTWADVVRDDPRFKRTAPLHYVNFPRKQCTFVMPRDCANGVCVIGGIAAFSRVLKDPRSSEFERLIALKWLVHLVGDLHQPMHVGYADDRGGNQFQIRYQSRGNNLHWLWDTGLIEARNETRQQYLARLEALPASQARFTERSPVEWAQESCRVLQGNPIYPEKRWIGRPYIEQMQPLLDQRLKIAGERLAATLNELLRAP